MEALEGLGGEQVLYDWVREVWYPRQVAACGDGLAAETGIPIVNRRIAVTPIIDIRRRIAGRCRSILPAPVAGSVP